MKKVLLWASGIVAGSLLLLAFIGYVAGSNKASLGNGPQGISAGSNREGQTIEATFANSDVDLCEAYHWIGEMEHQTRQYSERKQPGLSAIEREAQLSKERDRRWIDYANRHKIPDSVRVQINVRGMTACK